MSETITLPAGLFAWLNGRHRGLSSNAMVAHLCRLPVDQYDRTAHPLDPSDLGRCIRLLEEVPELRPRLPEMATLSPIWAALVARWDELAALMESEAPRWREQIGSAPHTYDLMQRIRTTPPERPAQR